MTRMGDMIQTTPLIKGLKKKHPNSKITILVTSDFANVVPLIPDVDDSIVIDFKQFGITENWKDQSWVKIYRYLEGCLERIKSSGYDLLVNLSHSKFSALMVGFLDVKNVVGFHCNGFGDRQTGHPWMQYFGIEVFNRTYNEFNLVEIFSGSGGVDVKGRKIEVVRPQSQSSVSKLIHGNDLLIGFQAGSSIEGRRWSTQSFAKLADMLIEKTNAKIIMLGVKSESKVAEEIINNTKNKNRISNLTGKTNLSQLAEMLEKCKYLVTNDTGTMHLAAALGTKILGLFFAHAHPYETAPFSPGHLIFQAGISCAPCSYGVHCSNIVCVEKVQPEHLLSAIENHILTQSWILPETINEDSEINVYETIFDNNSNFRLRSLVRHKIELDDLIRSCYTILWRVALEERTYIDNFMVNSICENLLEEYDCSNLKLIDEQLIKKNLILKNISKLAQAGKNICSKIIKESPNSNENFEKIGQYGDQITDIDKKIEVMGLSNPEVKPLTDMFNKRKENIEGNNLCSMSTETRKFYGNLMSECELLREALQNCLKKLSDLQSCYISHNSINVAVPGR